MPESVDAISARILAAPAPVLIPDTCAILDAIRSVFRFSIQGDVMPAAKTINGAGAFLSGFALDCRTGTGSARMERQLSER